MKKSRLLRKLIKQAGQETEAMREVKSVCTDFANFLNEGKYGVSALHELVDNVYRDIPEIEDDNFWRHVNEEYGAVLVAGLIFDTLGDLLQEEFNVHFNGTDLEFENMGDILNFLATEPGKMCANLPSNATIADTFELFLRVTRITFKYENGRDRDINITELVATGFKDVVLEGGAELDMILDGGRFHDL